MTLSSMLSTPSKYSTLFHLTFSISANGFYSASQDKKIMHVDGEGNPAKEFIGHESNVNSLSQSIPEELVSGSWDGTARVWDTNTGQCKAVLEGH